MAALNRVGLLAPTLGAPDEPTLAALQLPYRPDDVWLGLDFPSSSPASICSTPPMSPTVRRSTPLDPARSYCGLLLDEWSEVIPATEEATGLAFHYDRPNTEPPQTILLVTPPVARGAWQFGDLVDALHETLDLARVRAVEPDQLARTDLGALIPRGPFDGDFASLHRDAQLRLQQRSAPQARGGRR